MWHTYITKNRYAKPHNITAKGCCSAEQYVDGLRYDTIKYVCAVPGKGSHNNTIRTLERSLLAADTDGYADTESGTSHECAVRVPKGLQRLEHYVLTHNLSQVDLSAAWTGQQLSLIHI